MKKELKNPEFTKTIVVNNLKPASILPFTEKPACKKNHDEISAAELFLKFTADIIQQRTVFTR